jgi:hypothetical protein
MLSKGTLAVVQDEKGETGIAAVKNGNPHPNSSPGRTRRVYIYYALPNLCPFVSLRTD